MKNKIKYLIGLSFFVGLAFVSCEDFLNTTSKSTMDEDVSFSNLDFATMHIMSVYQVMNEDAGYSKRLSLYYGIDSDIEMISGADDDGRRGLSRYKPTANNSELESAWTNLYLGIERANICIDNLPESAIWLDPAFSEQAKSLYAEAVTLRALYYFELIKVWGDVPFKDHKTRAGDNFFLGKTDRDVIYKRIIEDLKEVADYLPWYKEMGTVERITKGFAKGLRARIALYYAGYSLRADGTTKRPDDWKDYYQIARTECSEIIESKVHELNPSYINIFKNHCSYTLDLEYGESMYETSFGRGYSGEIGDFIGIKHQASSKYGRADGGVLTHPYYLYAFDPEDERREVTVSVYDYNDASNPNVQNLSKGYALRIGKWRKQWIVPVMGGGESDQKFTGVNWCLMRYSDILLMFAETENEINNAPTNNAKEALRKVRERAFPASAHQTKVYDYINGLTSKTAFFEALINERKLEFGGEMLRKFDLVRWNLLGDKIAEAKTENLRMLDPSDTKYATLPDNLFYKRAADGESIELLNLYERLTESAIEGYEKSTWLSGMSDKDKESFDKEITNNMANGYNPAKNNHLYPIHQNVINDSNGALVNDIIK
jgi:hypothetical protein